MGRKIPAKKHRGVKDPLEQQARRLQSLKTKINAPPKDPDEQPVPRSLTRLFAFSEHANKIDKKTKKITTHEVPKRNIRNKSGADTNPVNRLRKMPGESGRSFSLRINNAVRALHTNEEQMDYPIDMEDEEDEKGMRMAAQRERRARKLRRNNAAAGTTHALPTRAQRRKLLMEAKKTKAAEEERDGREVRWERVAFGEVAHAPPALPAREPGASRPGRRGLLLTAMLPAEARRMERARDDAVAAYRTLKAAKLQNNTSRRPPIVL